MYILQEFFQGLESHMILTETFFRKISSLVVPRERQALEETLAQAQGILKQAHRRGVGLEYLLEVSLVHVDRSLKVRFMWWTDHLVPVYVDRSFKVWFMWWTDHLRSGSCGQVI